MKLAQSCLTVCNPMDYTVHGIPQAKILEWVAVPSPGDLPNPQIKPRSPTFQADSLPTELQGKPKNTGVPGHARKEGRHVAKMGASRGFSLSVAPVFGFSRGMMGSSGSLSCGAREVRAS